MTSHFVEPNSIVRKIWGKGDTILFIFAGSAAEFALNKAVDWLYFTGRLPADPLARLFSTVSYARKIIFSTTEDANKAIDQITAIHTTVEKNRESKIPDWAYRDVLYMLIHYSIASFEVMERKLSLHEKEEVFAVFLRVGSRMNLKDLPRSFSSWQISREQHLNEDLERSHFTIDLFSQYKKHLGILRYNILWESQKLVVPEKVRELLKMRAGSLITPLLFLYKVSRRIKLEWIVRNMILPGKYRQEIKDLDVTHP